MIYLFSGDDTKNRLSSYEKFIKSLPARAGVSGGLEIFSVSGNDFDPMQIESFYSGASLFSAHCAVIFQNVLEQEENRDFILDKLGRMGQSDNYFIFLEGKLNKPILDAFKKALPAGRQVASAINIFELPKEKEEKFDNFLVANAFANKDKLDTWIYFRQAVEKEVPLEGLAGVLFWKIKDMILKRNFGKFSEKQLKDFASKLSYLLPEARKKVRDAESALEQFLLEAF
jgi:hypothetical protein